MYIGRADDQGHASTCLSRDSNPLKVKLSPRWTGRSRLFKAS